MRHIVWKLMGMFWNFPGSISPPPADNTMLYGDGEQMVFGGGLDMDYGS